MEITKLRKAWKRAVVSGLALAGLGSIGPAAGQAKSEVHISAQSRADYQVNTEILRPWASGRAMMLLTARDVSDDTVTSRSLRGYIAARLGHKGAALLEERTLVSMAEALNTGIMAASKFDSAAGRPLLCLVSMGNPPLGSTPRALAAVLAGLPANLLPSSVPGTAQQWHTAALLHEAAHCGQRSRRYSSFDVVTVLSVEIDADQKMLNAISQLRGYEGIAGAFRDMRAIGALHFSDAGHMTAAALHIAGDREPQKAYSAQDVFAEMHSVINSLDREVGLAAFDRRDIYHKALEELLVETRQFIPAASQARHPLLRRAKELHTILKQQGPQNFVQTLGDEHPVFTDRLVVRAGSLIRIERGNVQTYHRFKAAAQRLLSAESGYNHYPVAARFLRLYVDAVDRGIVSTPPAPKPRL